MMDKEPVTYVFKDFAELQRVVPTEKIAECIRQIGVSLALEKELAELHVCIENDILKSEGKKLKTKPSLSYFKFPKQRGWVDDGKFDIDIRIGHLAIKTKGKLNE